MEALAKKVVKKVVKKASERGLTIEIINNYNYVNNATAPLRTGGQRD